MVKVYQFDASCQYAGDSPEFKVIPAGYINKTICGCGLTSVAIESEENCIIAVPNVALVDNKVRQYKNNQHQGNPLIPSKVRQRFDGEVFGVTEGVDKEHIDKYVERVKKAGTPIKIMVTYDSLYKCELYLNECHLIIDESDKLVGYQAMKATSKKATDDYDAISRLYFYADRYKDTVSFISATPIDVAFLPDFVSKLDQIELQWTNVTQITPITLKRKHPYTALQNEVINPIQKNGSVTLGDRTFSNVIVFINSVETITKIARECMIPSDDMAILCGDNSRNALKIRGYNALRDNYNNLPKFTFITSSGFQGIDLEDPEAMNVVVSCTNKSYQMIDLDTDLIQATSRQRLKTNPNYNRFVFIYDENPFDKPEAELIRELDEIKERIINNCEALTQLRHPEGKSGIIANLKGRIDFHHTATTFCQSEDFVKFTSRIGESEYRFNENVYQAYKYRVIKTRRAYTEGLTVVSNELKVAPIVVPEPKEDRKLSFYSLQKKFIAQAAGEVVTFDAEELAADNYKLIKAFMDVYKKIPNNPTYAKRMVAHIGCEEKQYIIDLLAPYEVGGIYKASDMKEHIGNIYLQYGVNTTTKINKVPKPTDLCNFGVEMKKRKKSIIYYEITKMPDLD